MSDLITTDHPLSAAQQSIAAALLDTLIPASDDGRQPSAGGLDLAELISSALAPEEFEALLVEFLTSLGDAYAQAPIEEREATVSALSANHPEKFAALYRQVLALYYRQSDVLRGIGSGEGPPFPRGNEVADGDLSLLDPVVANPKRYRRT